MTATPNTSLAKVPCHHRHRLPRRRQDDADPPSARECRRAAARADHQRVRRCRRRRRDPAGCGIESCPEDNIVELANGCICCTVADDFIPAIEALLGRPNPPEHIIIETSGLALPKPLVKAFDWPAIRSRLTVDGVIAVVDGAAVAAGRFADDPEAIARSAQPGRRPSTTTTRSRRSTRTSSLRRPRRPQQGRPDVDAERGERVRRRSAATMPRAVKIVETHEGRIDRRAARPRRRGRGRPRQRALPTTSRGASTTTTISTASSSKCPSFDLAAALVERLAKVAEKHDVLRMKGFVDGRRQADAAARAGRRHALPPSFRPPWAPGEAPQPARRDRREGPRPRRRSSALASGGLSQACTCCARSTRSLDEADAGGRSRPVAGRHRVPVLHRQRSRRVRRRRGRRSRPRCRAFASPASRS